MEKEGSNPKLGEYLRTNSQNLRISPTTILISYILSLTVSNSNQMDPTELGELLSCDESNPIYSNSAYRKVKKTLATIMSLTGFEIIKHLNEFGTFTKPALVHNLSLSWPSVNRVVNRFVTMGIVEQYGVVGKGYRRQVGRSVPVYGLPGIDPQLVIEAQKRYGALRGAKVSVEIVPEIVDEIVDAFKKREDPMRSVDRKFIELFVKQPSMKIPPFMRDQYIEQVASKLIEKGIEVYVS